MTREARRTPRAGSARRRERLDQLLVTRRLAATRAQAQAAILAGEVLVAGRPGVKPGALVDVDVELATTSRPRYVSRGGLKLEHALRTFGLSVAGRVAVDVGASTGGFTDCLLQHGAARVYAVDVGTGQLDWRLRRDPRVVVLERTHAARLDAALIPEPVDLATVDVSFTSVVRVLVAVAARVRDGGDMLVLVKPQFEAGRALARKGVVRSPQVHAGVLWRLAAWVQEQGWSVVGVTPSPLLGPKGNREFFLRVGKGPGRTVADLEGEVAAAAAAVSEERE